MRTALLNVAAAREQVTVAKQNVALANDNLARSKDRFASGVTDSVEVVQAEQALASANDQYITSLYTFNFAKLSLARAMGVARTGARLLNVVPACSHLLPKVSVMSRPTRH